VGTKFPVGDPLTPGGGPSRAELRLEEEDFEEKGGEADEVAQKGAPEDGGDKEGEVSVEGQIRGGGVPGEAPSPTWELFGHLVVEDTTRAGRYSVLRCVRCGAEASLLDLKSLKSKPCVKAEAKANEKEAEVAVSLPRRCENCGREATASLCDSCADTFEKYAEATRPAPLRGRGGIRPPSVPGVDGWSWVSQLTTFFPYKQGEGGREWWCPVPGCGKKVKRLIDIADHFRDAHPFEASRGWYEEFDASTRQVRLRTWQGWVNEDMEMVMNPEVVERK
jgi:ribosomal protein S14